MMRGLYALAWAVAAPFAVLRLLWRSRRQPGYAVRIGERFGRYAAAPGKPVIWIHAVSVGETRAAVPIVAALRERHPDHRILLTHMTATGRATSEEAFGDSVDRAWLPYDLGFAVRRFVEHFRPRFGLVLETELWPRLLEACAERQVPVILANARLSERSARRYARVPPLARWALGNLAGVAAQTEADARRLEALGAARVAITGNVKFDLEPGPEDEARGRDFRALWGTARRVIVAGSTREGEEALLLDAFAPHAGGDALLVIVPRHPQRFAEVAALSRGRGLETSLRSEAAVLPPSTAVLVGDSMGEMLAYYAAADVAIVGGSLLAYGSQNLIEPCALGKPVIVGPSTYNFEQAADSAIAAGAAVRVPDAAAAVEAALCIGGDRERREAMGARARAFVAAHRGATKRLMACVEAATPRA